MLSSVQPMIAGSINNKRVVLSEISKHAGVRRMGTVANAMHTCIVNLYTMLYACIPKAVALTHVVMTVIPICNSSRCC